MTANELREKVDGALSEGYRLWSESGIPLPSSSDRDIAVRELAGLYDGPNATDLAVACQCFHFFRKLHGMVRESPAWSTLLGDYFFSQFSKSLIPINSVPLTDAFSNYLKNDIQSTGDVSLYMEFIRTLPAVLK